MPFAIFNHSITPIVKKIKASSKEIHEKIGNAIEDLYPHRLEEFCEMLAYHYSKSDNLEKAFQYMKLSGKRAKLSFSNWEAFHYYGRAIEVLKKIPETEENNSEKLKVINSIFTPMAQLGT